MLSLLLGVSLTLIPSPDPALLESSAPLIRESPEEALLREAKSLRWKQRYFEAAARYRRFVEQFPTSGRVPDARFWLASTLEQDQRWDEAAAAYTDFLLRHPDQRMLGQEARFNRIRCWGIRQGQTPGATEGLLAALQEPEPETRVAAALQLAKRGDRRAIPALWEGLNLRRHAEASTLALLSMGQKPTRPAQGDGRFLVIRIYEAGKKDPVTVRLTLALARAVTGYLSDTQLQEARRKGVNLDGLTDQALNVPKGTELLTVSDSKARVTVTVE